MAFSFNHDDGGARTGSLVTPRGAAIATPGLLLYTHRGGAYNLTPDLLETLRPGLQGVQLDVLQFITQPKPEVLQGYGGTGRAFLALDDPALVLVAGARDPAVYEYTGAQRQATDSHASVTVHTGAATATPEQYVEAAAALGPDVWVALSDDVPADARSDRATKAVNRTVAWLGACLAAAAGAPGLAGVAAFAAVQGGQFLHERARCAEAVAAQPGVAGYVIAGLGTGESPDLRRQIVETVVPRLPPGAPRLLSSVGTPEEILEAVAQGIDLFDSSFVVDASNAGYALCFPVSPEDERAQQEAEAAADAAAVAAGAGGTAAAAGAAAAAAAAEWADEGRDDSKLSLWGLAYRTDRRPLVPRCACFACAHHTRAYVHHLLQAHEMTAHVLLDVHNTHRYLSFFAAIRAAIASGTFPSYRHWFLQRRQRWLVGGGPSAAAAGAEAAGAES